MFKYIVKVKVLVAQQTLHEVLEQMIWHHAADGKSIILVPFQTLRGWNGARGASGVEQTIEHVPCVCVIGGSI